MSGAHGYMSGPANIEAEYSGAELPLVQRWSGDAGYANLAVGARYTDTDLSPGDPGNPRQESHVDPIVAVDGARNFGASQVAGYGSYGFDMEEYYTRLGITRKVGASGLKLGVEAGIPGDRNYERPFTAWSSPSRPQTDGKSASQAGPVARTPGMASTAPSA